MSAVHPVDIRHAINRGQAAARTAGEIELDRILTGIFIVGGFAAVVRATTESQKRIAKAQRQEVERQGWVV